MRPFALVTLTLLLAAAAFSQQPQTSDVSNTQPLYSVNAKYVEGLGPGYWPTAGSGLTLNLAAGTSWCAGTVRTYAGGTLTMTNATTNYVYLDPTANCAPAASTSVFTAAQIPIAVVVTSGVAITAITDDRTWFLNLTLSSLSGTLGCSQLPTFTGDVLNTLCAMALQNIPNGTTMAGDIVAANSAAPTSPASGHDALYTDSTDLRFHDKNASGVIGTTAVAKTAATHKAFTAMSVAGVFTDTQFDFSDLTGSATTGQLSTVTLRRTCMIVVGADNGSALVDADLGPQLDQCFIPYAATVVEIEVMADAGTPNVIVQRSHLGTPTALLSGALATASSGAVACSNTGGTTGLDGTTTCTNTLQNTSVAVGDWIGLTSGTAGGTAKRMSIAVTMTVN